MGIKKKKRDGEDSDADQPKKAKSNLVPAIIIAIGLVAGAKLMGGGDKAPPAAGAPVETTTTTVPEGEKIKLEPITLNVSDGRFLKVGLTLQLRHNPKGGGSHSADPKEDATKTWAKALDLTIEVLGGRTYEELVTPAGRDQAKELLVKSLDKAFHGEIETVYFTEFVMQ